MGTNYYAKLNIEKSIVDALYISPMAKMVIERFNLHIGKSSAGWKFLFQEQEQRNKMKERETNKLFD